MSRFPADGAGPRRIDFSILSGAIFKQHLCLIMSIATCVVFSFGSKGVMASPERILLRLVFQFSFQFHFFYVFC